MSRTRRDWHGMVGQVFGRLTIEEFAGFSEARRGRFNCTCSCGKKLIVQWDNLRTGNTRSCGCLESELLVARNLKHGMADTPLFFIWQALRKRCYYKKDPGYVNYGARGISVCDEWQEEFLPFYEWAMAHGYAAGLQLDRRDNDKGYSPENCRFITRVRNMHNTQLLSRNNTSGYRGVSLVRGTYVAHVNSSLGPHLYKSGFKTAEEAAKYRDAHCIQHSIPLPLNFKGEQHAV